jgi:hypothetical protein
MENGHSQVCNYPTKERPALRGYKREALLLYHTLMGLLCKGLPDAYRIKVACRYDEGDVAFTEPQIQKKTA